MTLCKKHSFEITGCSRWGGGATPQICALCVVEINSKGKLYPLKKTLVKPYYKAHKTLSNMVKSVPIHGEGGESR